MLRERWLRLCGKAGLDGDDQWLMIQSAYSDPTRAYHNLDHIQDCLGIFDQYAESGRDPLALEMAIWFHDVVYDSRAADNEERSAEKAGDFLQEATLARAVSELIRATKHHFMPATPDSRLLCDIDLSILGCEPPRYETYAKAIRQEYLWVLPADYRAGRTRVLQAFLERSSIYSVREFRRGYEAQARINLQVELEGLAKEDG